MVDRRISIFPHSFRQNPPPSHPRGEWDRRFKEWKRNQGMKKIGEEATTKPVELRCPSWCRMFKKRDRIVPFEVSPIVPSPEQEVLQQSTRV